MRQSLRCVGSSQTPNLPCPVSVARAAYKPSAQGASGVCPNPRLSPRDTVKESGRHSRWPRGFSKNLHCLPFSCHGGHLPSFTFVYHAVALTRFYEIKIPISVLYMIFYKAYADTPTLYLTIVVKPTPNKFWHPNYLCVNVNKRHPLVKTFILRNKPTRNCACANHFELDATWVVKLAAR